MSTASNREFFPASAKFPEDGYALTREGDNYHAQWIDEAEGSDPLGTFPTRVEALRAILNDWENTVDYEDADPSKVRDALRAAESVPDQEFFAVSDRFPNDGYILTHTAGGYHAQWTDEVEGLDAPLATASTRAGALREILADWKKTVNYTGADPSKVMEALRAA